MQTFNTNKWFHPFFDEGDEPGTPSATDLLDEPGDDTPGNDLPTEDPAQSPAPTPALVDAEALAAALGRHMPQQAPPPKAPPTPEEIEAAERELKIWKPTKEWLAKLNNMDTQEEALREMRDGLTTQHTTITSRQLAEQEQRILQQISPFISHIQEEREKAAYAELHSAYPGLKDPVLKPVIDAVTDSFRKSGKTFSSKAELFKALASGVEAVVKVGNPTFKLAGASAAASTPKRSGIPVTTPGAGGGGGGKQGPAPGKSKALGLL